MGLIDTYPFVLSDDAIEKLRFVHDVIKHAQAGEAVQRKVAARWNERLGTAAAYGAEPRSEPFRMSDLP